MATKAKAPGRTKRSAARLAIVAAIRNGTFEPGAMLPSEQALTDIFGVSLGTVQAALRQLQQAGTIIRRRGHGTRVASVEPLSELIWHFRFIDKATGHPLRFVRQHVELQRVTEHGIWAEFLGQADAYVCINRRMTMSDGAYIHAKMYLDEAMVPGLAELDPDELDMISIRPFLEETYGLFTSRARHSVQIVRLSRREAAVLSLEPAEPCFEIHAKAVTADQTPVYFQRILARCTSYILDF